MSDSLDEKRVVVRHPSHYIREMMMVHGLYLDELHLRMGWGDFACKDIKDLVDGNSFIERATAEALERALGVKSSVWLAIQQAYDLSCTLNELIRDAVENERTQAGAAGKTPPDQGG